MHRGGEGEGKGTEGEKKVSQEAAGERGLGKVEAVEGREKGEQKKGETELQKKCSICLLSYLCIYILVPPQIFNSKFSFFLFLHFKSLVLSSFFFFNLYKVGNAVI